MAEGGNLVVIGSGELVRSLLPHGLVDELVLIVHPVVLGSGRRLFGPGDEPHRLELVDHTATAGGVVVATYAAGHGPASTAGSIDTDGR